ncbi:uncharacterized protein LOC110445105 isoform X2 [Mizuhopecten yessoensis]|uniref:uncharacterized protein LOC110445105 isoform X2 n=1 Tax=Mizuhopecten yessoensis TaxID=6573 RepID=UPI000B45D156|nr:uncharacterized protein LOC110445105 isoform X2 [Mizuhopecten yessoensis]
MQMDALRSWWEIPSIAHFCSLFRAAFQLPDFDIEDLEDGLLAAASEEGSPFLEDLFCRLLQGCYGRDDIEPYNFEIYLKDIMKGLAIQLKIQNPLEDKQFREVGLRQKAEILQHLCDSRLDSLDVMDQLKGFEGENMRVEALGKDSCGATYWYFYGSRLYKEDAEPVVEEPVKEQKGRKKMKEKDKKDKKAKGKGKKRGRKSTKTAKSKSKRETKQAQRTSSRTSTRVSSRLRALEEQTFEEDEDEEDDNDEDEEEDDVKKGEEDISDMNISKETDDQIEKETKKEIKQGENVEEENRLGIKNEKEKYECDFKTEEQDIKDEPERQNHDGGVEIKDEDDKKDDEPAEENKVKEELKNENMDVPMDTENSNNNSEETKLKGNTNENSNSRPLTFLGLPLPEVNPRWHLICTTYEDWDALAETFKESKVKCERDLCRCITQDFLPAIPDIMEAREKERRKRLLETAPKRTSSRISYKMKEKEEQEAILAEAEAEEEKQRKLEEEERRQILELEREEEEKRLREERQKNREERSRRLEQREQRAQLIAEGKEIPPELQYTAVAYNSKYREDEERSGQVPELDIEDIEEMDKVFEAVKNHKDAWPFMEPVDEEVAPGYHDVIKKPMDLSLIERKLKNRTYKSKKRFLKDINVMLENCRHFNGVESDLGFMANTIQRCLKKAVRIHMDKVKDNYEADEEFRIAQSVSTEKKYRPRRAASSRAMDTLHRAMNYDDDDYEQFDSDEDDDSDRSQSPKPYRDKIVRLEPSTATTKSSRLIPELSPTVDELGWSGEPKSIKQIDKAGRREWNIDGNVVSFNGKKLLYNFSKQNRQTSATSLSLLDAKKYSPYTNKHDASFSSSTDKKDINDMNTTYHQGQKYVYQVKRSAKPKQTGDSLSPVRGSTNSLLYQNRPLSPKGSGVPNRQIKQLGPEGVIKVRQLNLAPGGQLNVAPGGVPKVKQLSPSGQPQMIAKHGQSGGTVKIGMQPTSPGSPRLPMAINSVSPTGQRIIKIVAAPGQQPLQPGQVINLAELGLGGGVNKAMKVTGSVLQLKGQNTGIPLSGKTRIIYQGRVSKMAAEPNTGTPVTPPQSQAPVADSDRVNKTAQQTNAIITLGPSSGLSPLSTHNVKQAAGRSSEQDSINKSIVQSTDTQIPQGVSKLVTTPENKSFLGNSPVGTEPSLKTSVFDTASVISDKTSGDSSPNSDRSYSSDDDIPELFPMNPPQQPPKKRKLMESSSGPSLSPSKVFIQGGRSSPSNVHSNSPSKSPEASNSPKMLAGSSPKLESPPKLSAQSLLGPPKLTCPPKIQSPPKAYGPPKLTPVRPLDSRTDKLSEWKQNTNCKFPPYKAHQTNGPGENRKSVFDAFDIGDSTLKDASSDLCTTKQETNPGNRRKLICDSNDRTKDSVPIAATLNTTEQVRTSPACVRNTSSADSDNVSHAVEDRLCDLGSSESITDTGKRPHEFESLESNSDTGKRLRDLGSESNSDTGKKSPDKGNLFDNFATFLHTGPKTPSQPTSLSVGRNLFNSQKKSSSSSQSSSSSSSFSSSFTSSSHSSGRSIFDSISPATNASNHNNTPAVNISQSEVLGGSKPSLTQNMMDKVSAFAANLHTGSLASRLGNISPPKSSPGATSLHHQSLNSQGTSNREYQSNTVVHQDPDQPGQGNS